MAAKKKKGGNKKPKDANGSNSIKEKESPTPISSDAESGGGQSPSVEAGEPVNVDVQQVQSESLSASAAENGAGNGSEDKQKGMHDPESVTEQVSKEVTGDSSEELLEDRPGQTVEDAQDISPNHPKETNGLKNGEKDNSSYKSEIKELQAQLANSQGKIAQLEEQLSSRGSNNDSTNDTETTDGDASSTGRIKELEDQLAKSESAREEAEEEYQNLLQRISQIKATLGERLKSDSEEIAEYQRQVEDLNTTIKNLNRSVESLQKELIQANRDNDKLSHDLSQLRAEYQESMDSWSTERNEFIAEHKRALQKAEKAETLLQNMEMSISEDRVLKENVNAQLSDLQEQIDIQTQYAERFRQERDDAKKSLAKVQKDFEDFRLESRNRQSSLEADIASFKDKLSTTEQKLHESTETISALESTSSRMKGLEDEVKEKKLLIGKLRHEAVILNEHLTKALRMIKKESEGETCDKELISNLFISFVQLPRGDTKKFEVLQLISDYLGWDEDHKIQAGLTHVGSANAKAGLRDDAQSGGFVSMFAEFLEREASKKKADA